jgi:hypothetical protein
MPDIYTSPTSVNLTDNPSGLFAWLNDVTNYWFSNGILLAIWILILMGYLAVNKDDYAGATAVASYVVSVLALLLWIIDLASGWSFSIAIGSSLIFTAWLLADRRGTA